MFDLHLVFRNICSHNASFIVSVIHCICSWRVALAGGS